MGTRLGPAQIDVTLNIGKLLYDLEKLDEKISILRFRMEDIRKDELFEERTTKEKQKDSQQRIREAKSSRFGLMQAAGAILGGAVIAETLLAGVGAGAKRITAGVPILEDVGDMLNDMAQALRKEISDKMSEVLALIPAFEQTFEIQKARRFLGQPVGSAESIEMFTIQHEVIATLTAAERAQRALKVENLANVLIDHIKPGTRP